MTTLLLFNMHHLQNNLTRLTRKVDGTTETGREFLTELAVIRDQITNATDHIKAIGSRP